jgi:anti-sigma factor (TIGR02949 family)
MTKHEIDCEQALRQIFEYVDQELGEAERATLERHLHTCQSCYSRAEFEARLKVKLGELKKDDPEATVHERIKSLLKSF